MSHVAIINNRSRSGGMTNRNLEKLRRGERHMSGTEAVNVGENLSLKKKTLWGFIIANSVAIILAIIGSIFWAGNLNNQVKVNTREISGISTNLTNGVSQLNTEIEDVKNDLKKEFNTRINSLSNAIDRRFDYQEVDIKILKKFALNRSYLNDQADHNSEYFNQTDGLSISESGRQLIEKEGLRPILQKIIQGKQSISDDEIISELVHQIGFSRIDDIVSKHENEDNFYFTFLCIVLFYSDELKN